MRSAISPTLSGPTPSHRNRALLVAAAVAVATFSGPAPQATASHSDPQITLRPAAAAAALDPVFLQGRLTRTGSANNKTVLAQWRSPRGWSTFVQLPRVDDGRYRISVLFPDAGDYRIRTKVRLGGRTLDVSPTRVVTVTAGTELPPAPPDPGDTPPPPPV